MSEPDIDTDSAPDATADLAALTPAIARDVDDVLRAHAGAPAGAQNAPASGAVGSVIAGPLVRIVIARLLPVLESRALGMIDAEVAKIQAAHPELDLSFVHGLIANVFAAISGAVTAPSPAVGTMGPVT